jgi:hypothetical protein
VTPHSGTPLAPSDYERILDVLAECGSAQSPTTFREIALELLTSRFGYRHATVFIGSTRGRIFEDAGALSLGRAERFVPSYIERYQDPGCEGLGVTIAATPAIDYAVAPRSAHQTGSADGQHGPICMDAQRCFGQGHPMGRVSSGYLSAHANSILKDRRSAACAAPSVWTDVCGFPSDATDPRTWVLVVR